MADPIDLSGFYEQSCAFLTELAQDNTRDWFRANKDRYDSALKRPAERLLDLAAPYLEAQAGEPVRRKLFRQHRDVRFSEDKTPYHTHLHLMWSVPDGRGWFLGLSPTYATVGAGIMQFEPAQLDRWRSAVASDAGAALSDTLSAQAWRLDEPHLKRVPAPYEKDHPREALLRRKGLVVWQDDLGAALSKDPVDTLQKSFEAMRPVQTWLAKLT